MKANKLVKENGIEKCKRILDDLTDQGHNGDFYKELKRIVESYELVKKHNGLESAKHDLYTAKKVGMYIIWGTSIDLLRQAIADVESCQ